MDDSEVGVMYQLQKDGVDEGSAVTGDGNAIDFGAQTAAGTYTVIATDGNTCDTDMTGSASLTINTAPTAFNVTGGDVTACSDDSPSVTVGLDDSEVGVMYQLQKDGVNEGSAIAGDGDALDFGAQTAAGTYTVVATDGNTCDTDMTGSASLTINTVPTVFNVTGGDIEGCPEVNPNVIVGLDGSTFGVVYELFLDGSTTNETTQGTGNSISFGAKTTVGVYTIEAVDGNSCSAEMTGNASLTIFDSPEVTVNDVAVSTGNNLTLNASSPTAVAFSWTGPLSFTSTDANPEVTTNAQSIHSGDYIVEVTDANGCTSSTTLTVAINDCLDAGLDQFVECNATVLNGTFSGNGSGQWQVESGDGNGVITDPLDANTAFSGTEGETYVLRWTVIGGDCGATEVFDIMEVTFGVDLNLDIAGVEDGKYVGTELSSSGTITATTNSEDVVYVVGMQITLESGFSVAAGADFLALIDADICPPLPRALPRTIPIGPRTLIEEVEQPEMMIRPNPFTVQSTLDINLPERDVVNIAILDQTGRLVKFLVRNQEMGAGRHTLDLVDNDLPGGMLYIKMVTSKTQLVKKAILIKNGYQIGND